MPRKKNNFSVPWSSFQSRWKLWEGKKVGKTTADQNGLKYIKGDNTTLKAFYAKMLHDIEANEKKKLNHLAVVEYHNREGDNIPVYDTQSAQWMKPVWEILEE